MNGNQNVTRIPGAYGIGNKAMKVYLVGSGLDLVSTVVGLSSGVLVEANPVMASMPLVWMVAYKVAGTAAIATVWKYRKLVSERVLMVAGYGFLVATSINVYGMLTNWVR